MPGTAGSSHLPLQHPNHSSEPGRRRSAFTHALCYRATACSLPEGQPLPTGCRRQLPGDCKGKRDTAASRGPQAVRGFFCRQCDKLLLEARTEHKDCHRFNVAHLKKEVFKVSFTNETDSHALKRKRSIESIKAEKNF